MNLRFPLAVLALSLAAAGCSPDVERPVAEQHSADNASPAIAVPAVASETMRDAMTARRFAFVPDRGELIAYPASKVMRQDGAYTWHRADLSESHARSAIGGVLSLRTPSGDTLKFRYERHVEHPNGDWTWIGSVVGRQIDEAIITFGQKAAFGTIAQPGKEALRLTIREGVSWLVETDPRQIALLKNVGTRPTAPDFVVAPDMVTRAAAAAASSASDGDGTKMATASTTVNGVTRIDLLLGYTAGFVDYYGGQSQALTRLNNMVDITNEAYVNSQMPTQVRLVKTLLVNYTDANTNGTALEELTGFKAPSTQITPNPVFSELRAARDQYGADLVSLVRRFNTPENEGCGIAWLIGGGRRGSISASSEFFGYSVVSDGRDAGTDGKTYFCRDETLAHEIGHNLGSAHDRDTADGDDNVLQTNEYGIYDYSFGYKTTSTQGNFFTVMAYGDSGQTRYRVFSNPRTTFCGGLACGVDGSADNARSMTNTFPSVAAFRAEVSSGPTPPSTPTKPAVRDVNVDGRSDIVLHNVNSGELYAWLMNGSAIAAGQGNAFLPIGHTAIGSGDFNGDGRVDIVSASSADVRISYGQSTGFGTTSVVANRPPGVWAFAGATDVNADGKTDMIWHHRGSGELYYWLMNGSTIVGGNGNAYLPIGHVAIATADFDGDGRGDVLSASSTDVRISFARASGTYTAPSIVANRPAVGWAFAGAGDVNNDGRADVVWHNVNSGEIYYWLMQGATVSSGQGASYLPAGFAAITLGDFNGDGRADIVAASATEVRVALAQSTAGFAAATVINPRPFAGWKFVDNVERQRAVPGNDVDADGRSDIIWHNTDSGELYYWLLNGSMVTNERGATFLPPGFTSIATGDFNTDGRSDIVSSNGAEVRLSLALPAGGFGTATTIANRPPSSWAFGGVSDIDADGRGDILWHNTISGELYYWLMSSASVVGGQGGAFVPVGHQVLAMGDFNGDGQADALSANASEVRVSMALASGSFGPSTFVSSRPPAGWAFVGAADVNADGRSDVLWHNVNSGELYYWAMTGATVTGGQGGAYLPIGHAALAAGDFNADGRADVLSGNAADVRVSLALQTGGFAPPVVVRTRPPSVWRFVAPR